MESSGLGSRRKDRMGTDSETTAPAGPAWAPYATHLALQALAESLNKDRGAAKRAIATALSAARASGIRPGLVENEVAYLFRTGRMFLEETSFNPVVDKKPVDKRRERHQSAADFFSKVYRYERPDLYQTDQEDARRDDTAHAPYSGNN
jgi:hypothetical protein